MKKNHGKRSPLVIFFICLIALSVLYLKFVPWNGEVPKSTDDPMLEFNFRFNPIVNIGMEISAADTFSHFIKQL